MLGYLLVLEIVTVSCKQKRKYFIALRIGAIGTTTSAEQIDAGGLWCVQFLRRRNFSALLVDIFGCADQWNPTKLKIVSAEQVKNLKPLS